MGLFERQSLRVLEPPPSLTPRCGACQLFEGCKSQKMPVSGGGRKGILIVGPYPSREDDKAGMRFTDRTGKDLESRLRRLGVDMRRDCWLDTALACHPGRPTKRAREGDAVDHCRPHLLKTVLGLKPKVVILLGTAACDSLLGWLWKDIVGGIRRWAGYRIPNRRLNAWVCPTYFTGEHPFFPDKHDPVLERQFDAHLKAACSLRDRPYQSNPDDFTKFVEVVKDTDRAAEIVRNITEGAAKYNLPVTFDYETTTLKPWGPHAEIFSCAVAATDSGTDEAFSFPWHGPVIPAMRDLLANPAVLKDGYNCKFEEGWTRKHLGVRVRGWRRDGMLAAHALENGGKGRAITGLKFQAFVKLGVDPWSEDMELVLKSDGGNTPNRIKQTTQGVTVNGKTITLDDVLLYGGLDALYELKIGRTFTRTVEGR